MQAKCAGERTRKWNMVVDMTTLLNKESRKALQLLAGLKGTQLVIPRIGKTAKLSFACHNFNQIANLLKRLFSQS